MSKKTDLKWRTEQRKVSDLIPFKSNPRRLTEEQAEHLKKSLEEFDLVEIPAIDVDNTLIAGHQRMMIMQLLERGDEIIDVRVPNRKLTDKEFKKYNLRSNKNTGEWDMDILANEFEMDLLEEVGFKPEDFNIDNIPQEIVEDDVPNIADVETRSKLGDIWQLGKHRIMCGDCSNVDSVLLLLKDVKIDLCFTDPPYGVNVVKNGKVGACFGIAKKGKYIPVAGDGDTNIAKDFFYLTSQYVDKFIVWGGNYFLDFLPASDGWLIWDKRGDSGIRNSFADGEMAYCNFHTPVRIYKQLWNGMIREGEREKRVHPTQKPIKILSEILKDFSKKNEIVYDAFLGSGSTLIACEQTNRICYGLELEAKYIDVIIARWEKLTGQEAKLLSNTNE